MTEIKCGIEIYSDWEMVSFWAGEYDEHAASTEAHGVFSKGYNQEIILSKDYPHGNRQEDVRAVDQTPVQGQSDQILTGIPAGSDS